MAIPIRPLSYETLRPLLQPRDRDSHKGAYGHVLVVGGDHGTGGAALMAAEAAARSGSGLTSVATRPEHVTAFLQRRPELMVKGIQEPGELADLSSRASVMVLGPGLGTSMWSLHCLKISLQLAAARQLAVVLDADALNWLAKGDVILNHELDSKWILTPHAGEASRLLGIEREVVERDRDAAVVALQEKYGGVAILKGPGTLICFRQNGRKQIHTCVHGNPGMASGGMGDVLSGVLGALLAQHFSLNDAARIGVCVHSRAADLAAETDGERGLLATDLLPQLRRLLNP